MKKNYFKLSDLTGHVDLHVYEISNKPGRRSNPIPTRPDEEEEPAKPGKENPTKKKKKKSNYEVTF